MKRKIERLERIERLRRRLHEMSSWRLAAAAQERLKLSSARVEMIEAMTEGIMAYGAPAAAGSRRIRAIERELVVSDGVEKALEKRALDDGRLAKLADLSLESARETWREGQERRSLEELIDATLAADTASRKR